ncbi:MAG: protein-glutamate O-methyltransferase CheR [Methylobacteriaceae bacterium]|nr:protein-glutamate O-methyltransferase CheR [Methylobacteriaceae bacterium]
MTEGDTSYLRAFLKARSGLHLGPEKGYLLQIRLAPILRDAGLASLAALAGTLRSGRDPDLAAQVVAAMTTNETSFFRDRAPFEALQRSILPRLVEARAASRRLRIWSAAASTGQEAYSVAMILAEMAPALEGWTVDIVATDISAEVVARAKAGRYSQFEVQRGLPIRLLLTHFEQGPDGWVISPELRRAVDFRVQNLLDPLERLGQFDVVFCRNLLIYLDAETKRRVLAAVGGRLARGGFLCLGSTETVLGISHAWEQDAEAPSFFQPRSAIPQPYVASYAQTV